MSTDSDADGFGDACDPGYHDDGAVGIPDFNVFRSHFGRAPGPSGLAWAGTVR
ncbi:MAG: hypothetical protein QNK04_34220 [Myxococcota bacterium]|nr:hypothetical protein [Myxococcota bacterium]